MWMNTWKSIRWYTLPPFCWRLSDGGVEKEWNNETFRFSNFAMQRISALGG